MKEVSDTKEKKNSNNIIINWLKGPKKVRYWKDEVNLGVKNLFRQNSAKMIMTVCMIGLLILFIIAYFYHNLGLFVITVEPKLSQEGFIISSTEDFASPRVRLFSDALENCNNISVNEIATDVDEKEGEHNGKNYVAYTFFLKNGGKKSLDYAYTLDIENVTRNVDTAAWIMLISNGDMRVYAKERKDGSVERIYNYSGYPFVEQMDSLGQSNVISDSYKGHITEFDLEQFRYVEKNGLCELASIPFESDYRITSGMRKELEAGEIDKYTVVIWLEGDDPDCIDSIKNGTIGLGMTFSKLDLEEDTE